MSSPVQNNSSTNGSYNISDRQIFQDLKYTNYALYAFVFFFGTAINLWMLSSLLTSPEMRALMRNRLVCILLFNDLLRTSILFLLEFVDYTLMFEHDMRLDCSLTTFTRVLRFSLMWIENWYVIIFLLHYISTLLDFNPVKILSPRNLQIGTILILVGPWALCVIVAPSVMAYHSHKILGANSKGCLMFTWGAFLGLRDFGIVVPFFVKLALLVAIVVLYHRRKSLYSTMTSSLITPNTHIDDVKAYVAVCVIAALTQVTMVARMVGEFHLDGFIANIIYAYLSWYISELRCVVMPFAFLFLEDIRNRVKTWKPWYRPGPGIDLTVTYAQSKEDQNIN